MSIATFIPEIWSARFKEHLRGELIYANLFNRNYEGEITNMGDTVHINAVGSVTVKTYDPTKAIDDPEELTTTDTTLVIDQCDYFNFAVKDIDKGQAVNAGALVEDAATSASYGLATKVDTYCAGLLKAGDIKSGLGSDASPIYVDVDTAYDYLVDMRTQMNKANVPLQGRWIVVPPEFEGYMLKDSRFASAEGINAEGRLINGLVARAAGFDIYVSNNVPNTSNAKYKIMASTNMAGTFANQIIETEAYRPEKDFSDAVKGLHVYGAKLVYPEAVAVATVNFGAAPAQS